MRVANRVFHRNYEEIETYEAGIALTGAEVKSIKAGNIRMEQAFGKIINGEVYLINAEIPIYRFSRPHDYNPTRQRKLLLHHKEILRMQTKMQAAGRLTLAPMACYTKSGHIKLSLALSRGRGEIAKKKLERQEDIKRQEEQEMKEYMKK